MQNDKHAQLLNQGPSSSVPKVSLPSMLEGWMVSAQETVFWWIPVQ
jgi:hypothetical protein